MYLALAGVLKWATAGGCIGLIMRQRIPFFSPAFTHHIEGGCFKIYISITIHHCAQGLRVGQLGKVMYSHTHTLTFNAKRWSFFIIIMYIFYMLFRNAIFSYYTMGRGSFSSPHHSLSLSLLLTIQKHHDENEREGL